MEGSSSSNINEQAASAPWRPRKYVLVGMGVLLGACALIVVATSIFQPAHILFSATAFSFRAKNDNRTQVEKDNSAIRTFNLTSHNLSHRAGLLYQDISVSMLLQHKGKSSVRKTAVSAQVVAPSPMPIRQERSSELTVAAEAILDNQFYGFYRNTSTAAITIFARARFTFGLARSRIYTIRVTCDEVELETVDSGKVFSCYQ